MSADVSALKRALGTWGQNVLTIGVGLMVEPMRPYAPIGKVTERGRTPGELRASIAVDPAAPPAGADTFTARIVAPVIQAKTTDQGSPPHEIRATRAHGLLVFEIGGVTVFTQKPVNHPGNAPNPWWDRALRANFEPNLRYAALHVQFT